MLKIVTLLGVFIGLCVILTGVWNVAVGRKSLYTNGQKKLEQIQAKKRDATKKSVWEKPPIVNILTFVGDYLILDDDKMAAKSEQLQRAGLPYTARQFEAKKIVCLFLGIIGSFTFYFLGLLIVVPIGLAISVVLYFEVDKELSKIIKGKNERILQCLPPFILSVIASLKNERDIIAVIERYVPFADKVLKHELEKLVLEMKTGGITKALYNFAGRMTLDEITRLVNILVNINRGIEQDEALELLSGDMMELMKDNLTKQLSARPQKLKRATILPIVISALSLLYTLAASLPNTINF